jgi:hypothetical protein
MQNFSTLKQVVYIVTTGLQRVNYVENRKSYVESVLDIKSMFHSSLEVLFEPFFTLINIYRVQFVMRAETRVDRHVKCALLSELTDFS